MDIEEAKKLARNKIEADSLTQQVRDVIKITKWQKQDAREGFKETFKPLIKSQDSIKKSIDEQQNATIAQLKANQLALTQGFEQFNRLADMRELPYDNEEGWDRNWLPGPSPSDDVRMLNLENNFEGRDLELLKEYGFPRPNDFFEINPKVLDLSLERLKSEIKQLTGEISGRKKAKNPSPLYEAETEIKKMQKGTLMKYRNTMKDYSRSLKYKVGEGLAQQNQGIYFNNPHQLLDRLELLGG